MSHAPEPQSTGAQWTRWIAAEFESAQLYFGHGTNNAVDEAAWLVSDVAGIDYAQPNWPEAFDRLMSQPLGSALAARVAPLVDARIQTRKPLAYLLGRAWFCGRSYTVDERVLVPRSPIGRMIDEGFQPWIGDHPPKRVLELCTGSGCIAIAIAHRFPHAQLVATDLSSDALAVAAQNVTQHGVQERLQLLQGDLFGCVASGDRFDMIVTNPPYVDAEEMAARPPEFHAEPKLGLAAGLDGLDLAHRILSDAPNFLQPDGLLIMEVGASDEALQAAYPQVPFTWYVSEDDGDGILVTDRQTLIDPEQALEGA